MNEAHSSRRPDPLEAACAAHVTLYLVGVSWAFGGNADWVRTPLSIWGSLGPILTLCLIASPRRRQPGFARCLAWAAPVCVLGALVLISCLTPGFRRLGSGSSSILEPLSVAWWTPSAAIPETALRSLWLFLGVYFSAFNIALALTSRSLIRLVLAAAVLNALALSVFGTVQKLTGSTGIFFGAFKSPQDYFFASFVYDNHWGAFIVLATAACVGLVLRYVPGSRGEGFLRGPSLSGVVVAAIIGVSVPLSGSRACTLLVGVIVLVATAEGAPSIARSLQASGVPRRYSRIGILAVVALLGWGAWSVAGDVVRTRAEKSKSQIAEIIAQRGLGTRATLYRDTLRMGSERPAFGWGMGSFPTVFGLFNSQRPGVDHIPVIYHDAHSDWLQAYAEIGLVGTLLMACAVLMPCREFLMQRMTPLPLFLLLGCALVGAYALVEFPFGNVAVVLAWWVCFFCAVQYLRLSRARG